MLDRLLCRLLLLRQIVLIASVTKDKQDGPIGAEVKASMKHHLEQLEVDMDRFLS